MLVGGIPWQHPGEIGPSVEAWLSIYETRLRAKRPKASLAAQWISEASRSSVALMMQKGQNEVETTHGGRDRGVDRRIWGIGL